MKSKLIKSLMPRLFSSSTTLPRLVRCREGQEQGQDQEQGRRSRGRIKIRGRSRGRSRGRVTW